MTIVFAKDTVHADITEASKNYSKMESCETESAHGNVCQHSRYFHSIHESKAKQT